MIGYFDDISKLDLEKFEFCIVGAGAAGISLAVSLSRQGKTVLLIEGGGWTENSEVADAYVGKVSEPHPQANEFRYQRFGGTTHLWGGRCVPFDQHDFEERDYLPYSGWPDGAGDIPSYYRDALLFCDAGANDFTISSFGANAYPIFSEVDLLRPDVVEHIERYSLPTDFGKKFKKELSESANVFILLRTRCTKLNASSSGECIHSLTLSDAKSYIDIKVNKVVIAGGGIESTRLMLVSRKYNPAWSWLDENLGKYYACHYDLIFGALKFIGEKPVFDFQKTIEGVYARRKLQFSSSFQKKHGLLNSAFRLHFPAYADASHGSGVMSAIYLAKSILKPEYQAILNHGQKLTSQKNQLIEHILNVMLDIRSVSKFALDWLFKIKLAKRKIPYTLVANRNGTYPIEFNSEQVSDAENRIELIDEKDSFGMPRVIIHWKLTNFDITSGIKSFQLLKEQFNKTNVCRLDFNPDELHLAMSQALPVGGHHMGTTRMGAGKDDSVVDVNCKVHGVQNLYISSSSVFCTNSHANPTLTIVAIALRLAKHLSTSKKCD